MATKVVDTFKSSEFRLQAVTGRKCEPHPPKGGTPNCKPINEGCQISYAFFCV